MASRAAIEELRWFLKHLPKLAEEDRKEARKHLERLLGVAGDDPELARESFLPFVQQVWKDFIYGPHHFEMAVAFERIERGECKRLIVNLPPRYSKSRFTSIYFPAWMLGRNPNHKIMECSHTTSLSLDFGRQLRNTITSPEYQKIFPGVTLAKDAKAAHRWNTAQGGEYFAVGRGAAAAAGAVTWSSLIRIPSRRSSRTLRRISRRPGYGSIRGLGNGCSPVRRFWCA